jgi:hypothetical protein
MVNPGSKKIFGSKIIPPITISTIPELRFPANKIKPTSINIIGQENIKDGML